MLLHFVCPGRPGRGKNGKRAFATVNRATGKVTAHVAASKSVQRWYRDQVPKLTEQFRAYHLPPLAEFVRVDIAVYHADDILASQSADGDGVQSAVWDALQKAGILVDDRYVQAWSGERHHDPINPRVEIDVRTLRTS